MKNPIIVIALLVSTLAGVQAQVTGNGATTIATQPALPAPTAFAPVSRDAGSTVWERTVYSRGPNGTVVPRKSRYTELSSGLNFLDPTTKQWAPSREQIDLLPPGGAYAAAATHGQHSARFPLDIARGVIQLSGPDGKQLQSRPVGLFYEDDSNSVLIAILTNSVGGLVGSNEVVYPDAFEGAAASLHYKYTKVGFEQDVVVEGQLPDPGTLGLNPARTRLGVLTAFFDTNNPVATAGPVDATEGLSDSTLRFGTMTMTKGRAFSIGNTGQAPHPVVRTPAAWMNWLTNATKQSSSSPGGTPTYKRWFQLNGRNFLMEEVPYRRVAAQLQQLPPATGRAGIIATNLFAANSILNGVSAEPLPQKQFTKSEIANRKSEMMKLSRADWDQTRALVLDYVTVNSGGNYTFQGDTTYYVSGPCDFNNVTFQAGTVIKYPYPNSDWFYGYMMAPIEVDGAVTCNTSSQHPAVFTAIDDNTVGETISGSTGNPGGFYASPAIYAPGGVTLDNVRFRYASVAVWVGDGSSVTMSDAQMLGGNVMVLLGMGDGYEGYGTGMTVTLNNCLYGDMNNGVIIWDSGIGGDSYYLNNCTIDGVYNMVYGYGHYYYSSYGTAVNCIFANIEGRGYSYWSSYGGGYDHPNGFYNSDGFNYGFYGFSQIFASGYPFQTAAQDHYYLASGCPFRNAGSTDIDPNLQADLATLTTYAPQAGQYADNDGMPDLGYHYPIVNPNSDGDDLPDWWEMYWFGNLNHSGSDTDGNGNTFLYDYQNNFDPSRISFTVQFPNFAVNTNNATGSYLLLGGAPYYEAVLVNDTNFNHAVWTNYEGIIRASLGQTDGVYHVWFGLKGFNATAQPSWLGTDLTLTRTKPHIVITNPTTNAVAQPYLQLQGYSALPLAGVTFDVSNAVSFVTNQLGSIIGHTVDTNTSSYTTDYFQCYDIPLTNGLNAISVHCTDPAGNVTTTNLSVTLDYNTASNPVIKLAWPRDGMQICQSSFTLRGWTEDSMAQVGAQIVDAGGNTNILSGVVERSGVMWVENLPLAGGNNVLTLWVTNSAGLSSETNIVIVKSDMTLTLSTIDGDLWMPKVNVHGAISDTTASVWVNGVAGTNYGNGTWEVDNVPVTPGGVASFDMKACPAGGGDPDANDNRDKPNEELLAMATWSTDLDYTYEDGSFMTTHVVGNNSFVNGGWITLTYDWTPASGPSVHHSLAWTLAAGHAFAVASAFYYDGVNQGNYLGTVPGYGTEIGVLRAVADGVLHVLSSDVRMEKKIGGRGFVGQQVLVAAYVQPRAVEAQPEFQQIGAVVPSWLVTIGNLGGLGSDYWVYGTARIGDSLDVTPRVAGIPMYHFQEVPDWVGVGTYAPSINANGFDLNYDPLLGFSSPEFCVGQKVTLQPAWNGTTYWLYSPPNIDYVNTTYSWALAGTFVNRYTPGSGSASGTWDIDPASLNWAVPFGYWTTGGSKNAYLTARLHFSNGQSVTVSANGQFNIFKPHANMINPAIHGTPMNVWTVPWNLVNWGGISLGIVSTTSNMSYVVQVISSDFAGDAKITQLCTLDAIGGSLLGYNYSILVNNALDGSDPYGLQPGQTGAATMVFKGANPPVNANEINLDDAPGTEAFSPFHYYGSFDDYIMFKPSGDGIYVTIGKVTWGTTFGAIYPSMTINPNSVSGPTGPDSSHNFPVWTTSYP